HHRQPDGGVQGDRQPLRRSRDLRGGAGSGGEELLAEPVDVRSDVHAHQNDTMMTSWQVDSGVRPIQTVSVGIAGAWRSAVSPPAMWRQQTTPLSACPPARLPGAG